MEQRSFGAIENPCIHPNWIVIPLCTRLDKRAKLCRLPPRWEALSRVKLLHLAQAWKIWDRLQPIPVMKQLKSEVGAREYNIITLVGLLRWEKWWTRRVECWE